MWNRKDHQKFNKIQELEEFERFLLLPLCLFFFRDGIKKKTKIGASFSFGKKAKISKWQWI